MRIIQCLRNFPAVVEHCAQALEPQRMTTYLQGLVRDFHHYYERHRVVTEDRQLTSARLVLIDAVRIVLKNALRILGISAPEQM